MEAICLIEHKHGQHFSLVEKLSEYERVCKGREKVAVTLIDEPVELQFHTVFPVTFPHCHLVLCRSVKPFISDVKKITFRPACHIHTLETNI